MKKIFRLFKKAVKWYFYKTAEAYYLTPTGMFPLV